MTQYIHNIYRTSYQKTRSRTAHWSILPDTGQHAHLVRAKQSRLRAGADLFNSTDAALSRILQLSIAAVTAGVEEDADFVGNRAILDPRQSAEIRVVVTTHNVTAYLHVPRLSTVPAHRYTVTKPVNVHLKRNVLPLAAPTCWLERS